MGTALLKGWVARNFGPFLVVEPNPTPELRRFARKNGIPLFAQLDAVDADGVAVCVVAIKPQILRTEAARFGAFAVAGALILSIAAGTSTRTLARACGRGARIIRAMPNLPGSIGRGVSGLYAPARVPPQDRELAERLLAALGEVVWVGRESLIDAVTAVSGSGPAYVFLLVEALAQAGEAAGLSRGLAMQLARATVTGSAALLDADARPASELRRDVTSPGGTTAAALEILMQGDALHGLMRAAVAAAKQRAEELSA